MSRGVRRGSPASGRVGATDLRFILEGNRRGLAGLALLSLGTAVCEAFLLGSVVQAVAGLSAGRTSISFSLGPGQAMIDVRVLLGLAVLAALVRGVLTTVVSLAGPKLTAASRERHRRRIFRSYLHADWATQSSDRTGHLMQTLSSSVNEANTFLLLLTLALPAFLTLMVLLVVALLLNPIITGVLLVIGALIGAVLRPFSRRAHAASQEDTSGRSATASHIAGVLAAGAEVAVLGSGPGVLEVGNVRIAEAEGAFARAQGLARATSTAGQSVAFLMAALGLWVLSLSSMDVNFATVGTIAVLLLRGAALAQLVQGAASQYGAVAPFATQIRLLVERYEQHRRVFGSRPFPTDFDITMNGVSYTYPGSARTAINVEQVRFPQGSSTAIIGPSGSGKSTLIQLLLRMRTPTQGEVRFGEFAAPTISEEAFSARVAYLPQAPHLVPGTVLENIQFFRPGVSEERAVRAARLAHIHEDITEMPQGYDTLLDSHVDSLSGGQKQRLALARALANDPAVLVLDEPTSALDGGNEEAVLDTLRQLHGHTTIIMITHKPSTVVHCDAILRVEHGVLHPETSVAAADVDPVTVTGPAVPDDMRHLRRTARSSDGERRS